MPSFLRRWVALEGHEAALRQELLLVHETYTRKSPHVVESLMYREHFLGAEFIGLIVYGDDAGLERSEERRVGKECRSRGSRGREKEKRRSGGARRTRGTLRARVRV